MSDMRKYLSRRTDQFMHSLNLSLLCFLTNFFSCKILNTSWLARCCSANYWCAV